MCPHFLALQSREHLCNVLESAVPAFKPRHTPRRPCPRGSTSTPGGAAAARGEGVQSSGDPRPGGSDDPGGRAPASQQSAAADADTGSSPLRAGRRVHRNSQAMSMDGDSPDHAGARAACDTHGTLRARPTPLEQRAPARPLLHSRAECGALEGWGTRQPVAGATQGPGLAGRTPPADVGAFAGWRQGSQGSGGASSPATPRAARTPPAATRKRRRRGPVVPFYSDGPSTDPGRTPAQTQGATQDPEDLACDPPNDSSQRPVASGPPQRVASQDSFAPATRRASRRGVGPTASPPGSQGSTRPSPRPTPCICGGDECEDGPGRYYDVASSGAWSTAAWNGSQCAAHPVA